MRNGLNRSFDAFIKSSNLNFNLVGIDSAQVNLSKFIDILKNDNPITIDGEPVNYHLHVSDYLSDALKKLREEKPLSRIVVFIDDLDRCSPDNALELLESVKTFFDIEGIVYVIGMNSDSITSIVKKKYGDDFSKGLDYMQKIVQLPFQIPSWKENDISKSISMMITRGLDGSPELIEQFENNKELIVKIIQLNPRELKRFINTVILSKLVSDKEIDELIVVQGLTFRREWNVFLDLLTPDDTRKAFLTAYIKSKERDLQKLREDKELVNHPNYIDIVRICDELCFVA